MPWVRAASQVCSCVCSRTCRAHPWTIEQKNSATDQTFVLIGTADLNAVKAVVKALESTRQTDLASQLKDAFATFDSTGDGSVSISELTHVRSPHCRPATKLAQLHEHSPWQARTHTTYIHASFYPAQILTTSGEKLDIAMVNEVIHMASSGSIDSFGGLMYNQFANEAASSVDMSC